MPAFVVAGAGGGRSRAPDGRRRYARAFAIQLIQDLPATRVNIATGETLPDLIIDPRKDRQPTGRQTGPS